MQLAVDFGAVSPAVGIFMSIVGFALRGLDSRVARIVATSARAASARAAGAAERTCSWATVPLWASRASSTKHGLRDDRAVEPG